MAGYYEDSLPHGAATKLGEGSAVRDMPDMAAQTDVDIIYNHLVTITDGLTKAAARLEGVYVTWSGEQDSSDNEMKPHPQPIGKHGVIISLLAEQHRQLAAIEKQITNFERMV